MPADLANKGRRALHTESGELSFFISFLHTLLEQVMIFQQDTNRYVGLSEKFAIKGSKDEQVLLSLCKGSRYELDFTQYELLTICDGNMMLIHSP